MDSKPSVSPRPCHALLCLRSFAKLTVSRSFPPYIWVVYDTPVYRLLQDDIKMMWEPSVIATQVEPYVTDYGIDTVSGHKETP